MTRQNKYLNQKKFKRRLNLTELINVSALPAVSLYSQLESIMNIMMQSRSELMTAMGIPSERLGDKRNISLHDRHVTIYNENHIALPKTQ